MADPWAPVAQAPSADAWTPVTAKPAAAGAWAPVSQAPHDDWTPVNRTGADKAGQGRPVRLDPQARDFKPKPSSADAWTPVAAPVPLPKTHGALDQLRGDWRDYRAPTTGGAGNPGATPGTTSGRKIEAADRLTGDIGGVAGGLWHDTADTLLNKPIEAMTGGRLKADDLDVVEDVVGPVAVSKMGALPARIRAPKEPLFADPAGQYRPKETPKPGPIYGDEAKTTERLDNALHRLQTRHEARKVQALQNKARLKRDLGDQYDAEGENLSHELEGALADPKRKLSDRGTQALSQVQKTKDRQRQAYDRVRQLAGGLGLDAKELVEETPDDVGYVPRQVKGLSKPLDGLVSETRDPVTGGGLPLNKSTGALKGRSDWRMLQPVNGKGEPIWVSKEDAAANPGRYDEIGSTIAGSNGQKFRVRQPTMAEIEKNTAGTDEATEYHKNYFDLVEDAAVRMEQVADNLQVLDASLRDLKAKGLAHREEWLRPEVTKGGKTVYVPTRGKPAPQGFVELPHVKQLKGWKFAPDIADVFKDYKPPEGMKLTDVVKQVNGTLTSTLFWNPVGHTWNVANDWAKGRGFAWLPGSGGYSSLIRNGNRAVQAVATKNEDYTRLLNEGASLMSAGNETRNYQELMLRKGVTEISKDRNAMSTLMHSFDLKGVAPQKLIAAIYKASSKELWRSSDVMMTQRIFELEERGLPTREAIAQAEKDIASYRVPSKVAGSRAVSEAVRNPALQQFGRYHYSVLKSWGYMFRDAFTGTPAERTEAAGKFIAAMIMVHGAYPIVDGMLQKATGDDSARLHRGGAVGLLDSGEQLTKGQKDWSAFLARIVDPSPVVKMGVETLSGRSFPFGQRIINPQSTPAEQAAQLGEHVAGYVGPAQEGLAALKPGGLKKEALKQALVDTQDPHAERGQRYGQQKDKKAAARARRKDPIIRAAGELFP